MKNSIQNWFSFSLMAAIAIGICFGSDANAQETEQEEMTVTQLMRKADGLRLSSDNAGAAKAYAQVVEKDPEMGAAWFHLGYTLHMDGKWDEALKAHLKASTFSEWQAISLFNAGCAYSLKKDADNSLKHLRQSVDANFDRLEMLETDADLEFVRKDPRFKNLIAYANGEEPEFDAKSMIGEWKMISGERSGDKVPAERLPPAITISDETFTLPSPDGGEGFVMSYALESSKSPMEIDFNIEAGPVPEGESIGIIKIENDKMTLCYDSTNQARPDKFETAADDGRFLFVLKKLPQEKKAEKKAADSLVGKWSFVSGTRAGEDVAKDRLAIEITIDEEKITLPAGPGVTFVMSYKIDKTKTPFAVDMSIDSGPAPPGSEAKGIVKMAGDSFTICYDYMGGARPEKFESTAENQTFMFKLKRAEEKN
jgi:uncharacterized protein (TIGR03067 family)